MDFGTLHDRVEKLIQSILDKYEMRKKTHTQLKQLSMAYFSQDNIQKNQNAIRSGIYHKSHGQYLIGPQDCDSLIIVMRSVFLQHATNQPDHILEQITDLNKMVVNYCIQQIYSEAQEVMKYVNEEFLNDVEVSGLYN